jgi:hypothetical protein
VAIATAFGAGDFAEAKRPIEILFQDADIQTGEHFAMAQHLHDQLGLALNNSEKSGRQAIFG